MSLATDQSTHGCQSHETVTDGDNSGLTEWLRRRQALTTRHHARAQIPLVLARHASQILDDWRTRVVNFSSMLFSLFHLFEVTMCIIIEQKELNLIEF